MGIKPRNPQPAQKPKKKPRIGGAGLVGAVAAALFALLLCSEPRWPETQSGAQSLSPDTGYKAAVDELARAGLLRVRTIRPRGEPPVTRIELAVQDIAEDPSFLGDCRRRLERSGWWPFAVAEPARDCLSRVVEYVSDTYLQEDMRRPSHWELADGRVTALSAFSHVLVPAGDSREVWRGRIRYADEVAQGDASPGARASLMLAEVATHRPLHHFADGEPTARTNLTGLLAARSSLRGGSLQIALAPATPQRSVLASDPILLQRLGRAVLLGVPPELHGWQIYVDGRRVAQDQVGFDNFRFELLRSGQYLTLEQPSGARIIAQVVETPGSISEISSGRRLREPSLQDVAIRLEQSGVSGDVTSTIQAALHLDLQRRLTRSMESGLGGAPPAIVHRGAVLLMDGLSGEIAAAASYPTQPLPAADPNLSSGPAAWHMKNWNFEPIPVGSAAKVPFAAAIAQSHPQLLRLTIPFHRTFNAIDGAPMIGLDNQVVEHGNGRGSGSVDFESFIADSNNEFALTLMRRATRADAGRWKSPSSWPANLWRFACVMPFRLVPRQPDYGWRSIHDGCSVHLWRGANGEALGDDPVETPLLWLQMGRIRNDYTDLYLSILGHNRSSWTTVNLAQAYARILSGREVNPRLSGGNAAAPQALAISPPVWSAVSRGMSAVLTGGTADQLWRGTLSRLPPTGAYFYAKTGTSTLSAPAEGDGHILVLLAARTRSGQPPQRPSDICALKVLTINLQRDKSSAQRLAADLFAGDAGRRYLAWMTRPCPAASGTG